MERDYGVVRLSSSVRYIYGESTPSMLDAVCICSFNGGRGGMMPVTELLHDAGGAEGGCKGLESLYREVI